MEPDFALLDRLRPSDLTAEVARRMGEPLRPIREPHTTRRRVIAGAVATLVFAAAAAFAWTAFRGGHESVPADDPWAWAPVGWSELPPPPEWRDGAAIVWTGEELLYWGGTPRGAGEGAAVADGFAFSPATRTWRRLPPAPWPGGNADAVWTGSKALFFDARIADGEVAPLAFDPVRNAWRPLPPSPLSPLWGGAWAWTGEELVVVGGGGQGDPSTREAAALNPQTESWRLLPEAPAGVNLASAVWTGREVVVVGSEIDSRNRATTVTSIAMAYDPAADAWRRLPDPPVSAQTAAAAYIDDRIIAWESYSPAAAEYVPAEDRWRSLDTGELTGSECYAEGASIPDTLVTWDCGWPAAWFAETSSWVRIGAPAPDLEDSFSLGLAHAAGSVVVAEHVESISDEGGGVSVGSPRAPAHLWLWRPPEVAPSYVASPSAHDARDLVDRFMSSWGPGWQAYLLSMASADVISRSRVGEGGLVPLEGENVRDYRVHDGVPADGEAFEVLVEYLRDGEVVATVTYTVGPGTTADGRDAQLVIVDVRPADRT